MRFAQPKKGFTLIEVLVVIAILAILAIIGITIFSNVQKGVRDAKRKSDVSALAQAYEVKSAGGAYQPISNNDFGSDIKPTDPNKGEYFNWFASDGSGFKVCASLDDNPNIACNTPAQNCFCKMSAQGAPSPSSAADPSSTQASLGLGGASASDCDPNGILFAGLVGYWKMDEASGNTVTDSTTNSYNGIANGSTIAVGKFGNARRFTASSDTITFSPTYTGLDNLLNFTYSLWVNPENLPTAEMSGQGLMGKNKTFLITTATSPGYTGLLIAGVPLLPNPNSSPIILTTPILTNNTWQHVVMVFSSVNVGGNLTGNIKVYINGVEAGYNPNLPGMGTGLMGDVGFPLAVGNSGALDVPFKGLIDDVRVYNRALQPSEISLLQNEATGCTP